MIKKLLLLTMVLCSINLLSAQDMSMEDLKSKKADLESKQKVQADAAAAFQGDIDALAKEIQILSGWNTGFTGVGGLNFGGANQWIASPNPSSSSSALAIGITGFANRDAKKYFWNNKLMINKAWQDIDLTKDEDDDLLDQGTVDLLNVSSLAGYKLTDKIALSGLAELNTSLGNFLEPGAFDIGVGVTWLPIENLVVVIHPLNYHIAWSADGDADSAGSIGAKIRADYQNSFTISGRKIGWSSTFTSFLPYSSSKTAIKDLDENGAFIPVDATADPLTFTTRDAGLFEYTWLNTFSFEVWKGIGVGFTFGIRDADFEYKDLQTFYTLGLSYTL